MRLPTTTPVPGHSYDYRSDSTPYITHLSPIHCRKDERTYVVLPGDLDFRNPEGLLLLYTLLNAPKTFKWSKAELRKRTGMSHCRVNRAVALLKAAGHLRIETRKISVPGKKPRFHGQRWFVTALPVADSPELSGNDFRDDGTYADISRKSESNNHSLTLSEAGEGSDLFSPGEPPTVSEKEAPERDQSDSAGAQIVVSPSGVHVLSTSPAYSEFVPPKHWNRVSTYKWVLQSHFAEVFRSIVGTPWDMESARMFYRRFNSGVIRPYDILMLQHLGRGSIRLKSPKAAGSLKGLCQCWNRLLNLYEREEISEWRLDRCHLQSKHALGGSLDTAPEFHLALDRAEKDEVLTGPVGERLRAISYAAEINEDWARREMLELERTCGSREIMKALEEWEVSSIRLAVLLSFELGSVQIRAAIRKWLLPKLLNAMVARNCSESEAALEILSTESVPSLD